MVPFTVAKEHCIILWYWESQVGAAGILTIFKRTGVHPGRTAMNERRESKTEADRQHQTTARKPWHAPCFNCTGIAMTYAVGNANTDGATTGLDGSLS
jgi:hypothetical protein